MISFVFVSRKILKFVQAQVQFCCLIFGFFYLNFLLKESKVDYKTAKIKRSERT